MPTTTRTEWMHARSVVVEATAIPHQIEDDKAETNSIAAVRISRASNVGAVVIEGRPEELLAFARTLTAAVEQVDRDTDDDPRLLALYGRSF